jgi:hypothetical protein
MSVPRIDRRGIGVAPSRATHIVQIERRASATVLVVDDDGDMRWLLRDFLDATATA